MKKSLYTFIHKPTTKCNLQMAFLLFSSAATESNEQDCGISKVAKDTSLLPSKIDPIKASQETSREANIGFGCAFSTKPCCFSPTI